MLSFPDKLNISRDLNPSGGVGYALSRKANAIISSQSLNTTDLEFQLFYKWTYGSICHRLPQLQYQIKHHIWSQICCKYCTCQETTINFLQFLMENIENACIMDIGSFVERVACNIVDVIAGSWIQLFSLPLSMQINWKLKACHTVKHRYL